MQPTTYYVTETARGTFAVVEHNSATDEEIIAEYDFYRDAIGHADYIADMLARERRK